MPQATHGGGRRIDLGGFDARPLGAVQAQAVLQRAERPVGVGHFARNEQRVVEFSKELQKLSTPPLPATNDVPVFAPETPEIPKP